VPFRAPGELVKEPFQLSKVEFAWIESTLCSRTNHMSRLKRRAEAESNYKDTESTKAKKVDLSCCAVGAQPQKRNRELCRVAPIAQCFGHSVIMAQAILKNAPRFALFGLINKITKVDKHPQKSYLKID
jgi:hypothetical protein